jgi:hypothetical protein
MSMDSSTIFQPFFATLLLTMVVWLYMYARRLPFLLVNNIDLNQLTPNALARISPAAVSTPSDNLKNLFELPTVFYAVTLYLYVTQQVDREYLIAAWGFFVFRVLHSVVHCTFNFVPLRFFLYVFSAGMLWFMVVRAAWALLA